MRKRALAQSFDRTPPWVARGPSKGCQMLQGNGGEFDRNLAEGRGRNGSYQWQMTYRVSGIDPAPYAQLFNLSDEELAARGVVRMAVTSPTGFPCRVSLTDRKVGETVLLLNHVSLDLDSPYRASHAIFVTETDQAPAHFVDQVPPVFETRILSLRGFDSRGMMVEAALSEPGQADGVIRHLLGNPAVETIHAHNAARGCFSARIERQ